MGLPEQKAPELPKRGFNSREAARYIGMSDSFLRKDRMNGKRDGYTPGPRWVRIGSRGVLYLKEDLDDWLDRLRTERERRRVPISS